MPDQVTQVQPSGTPPASGDGGGGGFGPGLIIGVVVVILIIIGAALLWGIPGYNGGDTNVTPQEGANDLEAPAAGGIELPSEIDIDVNTPQ